MKRRSPGAVLDVVREAIRGLREPFTVADAHEAVGGAQVLGYDAVAKAMVHLADLNELAKELVSRVPDGSEHVRRIGLYRRTSSSYVPPPVEENPELTAGIALLQGLAVRWTNERHAPR